MYIQLNATYKDGVLILDQRLESEKEGKKFKVIILEQDNENLKKERFFNFLKKYKIKLPENFTFKRDEIYDR